MRVFRQILQATQYRLEPSGLDEKLYLVPWGGYRHRELMAVPKCSPRLPGLECFWCTPFWQIFASIFLLFFHLKSNCHLMIGLFFSSSKLHAMPQNTFLVDLESLCVPLPNHRN